MSDTFEEEQEDDKKWKDIIKTVDTNNDGNISFDEFQTAI
jgi:Ca2+-binding EF-hand superfamily protein